MSFIIPGFWYTGFCYIRYLQFKVWKAGCGFDCLEEKLGLMYSSFIYIAALRKQVEAYTDCVRFSCTMHCSITISHQPLWFWRFYVTFFNQHKEKCIDGNTPGIFLKLFKTLTAHVLSLHWKLLWADTLGRVKKVSMSGAGYLQEYKNSEFVWELRKKGFSEGCCK